MRKYFRLLLGGKSKHAPRCLVENFIGVGYGIDQDISEHLTDDWRSFNKQLVPVYLRQAPKKSRIAAGLACGVLWTVAKGIREGDYVLCPNGEGDYRLGEVVGPYSYHAGDILPHQRPVHWLERTIEPDEMSSELGASVRSRGTMCEISKHAAEIERIIAGQSGSPILPGGEAVEDPTMFALEKHLEDFLIQNWEHTELGKDFVVYEEDGECVGQQYPTDTGPIDILAVSKDKKRLLVIELKKGKASDAVVGQALRYMGYVQNELAEKGQSVGGAIIALEDDKRIRWALAAVSNISFYRYQVSFKLVRA